MIHAVQQQALMPWICAQIGRTKQGFRRGQARLIIAFPLALHAKQTPEAQQSLGGDGSGGAVHGFPWVVRLRRFLAPGFHVAQSGRARVPVGNAVYGRIGNLEICGGLGAFLQFL